MKRNIVIAAVTAAALIGGGTATALAVSGGDDGAEAAAQQSSVRLADDVPGSGNDDGRDDDSRDDREDASVAKSAKVTAAEAVDAALAARSGTVTSAELDEDDGRVAWEIDVLGKDNTWYDVTVDPGNGKVLGTHRDDDGDEGARHVRAALKDGRTDLGQAVAAALKNTPGTVTSADLDDDGDDAWDVEVVGKDGKEHELRVDLRTAKVTADDSDDGDDRGSDDGRDDHDDRGGSDDRGGDDRGSDG